MLDLNKPTVKGLLDQKGKRQLTVVLVSDHHTAKACEIAGIDILVSESESLKTVRTGAPNTFLYAALPYGLGNISDADAIRGAVDAMVTGADALYSSGMSVERIEKLAKEKIPVIGHVGLVPWHSTWFGGFRAVGKTRTEALKVYQDAIDLQNAGAIAIEMECVPHKVAAEITRRLNILVISLGSGMQCDAQYLFARDILGTHDGHYPRHAKQYRNFFQQSIEAFCEFKEDVFQERFPQKGNVIEISDREFEGFLGGINGSLK